MTYQDFLASKSTAAPVAGFDPQQLEVIRRGLQLWSNPGDVVLSPFAGIGSEGYCSIQAGRQFVGFELKPSYFNCAVKNLTEVASNRQGVLV
jgi:DNA modification methylase